MKANRRRHIGQYEIGKKLGEGTFGKVRLGKDIFTGEQVAIKIVNYKKIKSQGEKKLIEREKKALTLLDHPNIVKLHKVVDDEERGCTYMILEYVSGGELFDYIVAHGRIKERDARKFIRQIISALEYCHGHLIVHRDLKPENLLLSESLNIKITDFGLSNIMKPGKKFSTFCGSLHYACPEILRGEEYVGPGADIWALGVILYCLVTGCQPWKGKSSKDILDQIIYRGLQMPTWLSKDCSDLILQMLKLKEKDRITISDMKKHPWVMKEYDEPPLSFLPSYNSVYFVFEDVIQQLEEIGFNIGEKDINEIMNGGKTQLVATYHLLVKKREDELRKKRVIELQKENDGKKEEERMLCSRTIVLGDEEDMTQRSESEPTKVLEGLKDEIYKESAGSDAVLNIHSPLIMKSLENSNHSDEMECDQSISKRPILNVQDIPKLGITRKSKISVHQKNRKPELSDIFKEENMEQSAIKEEEDHRRQIEETLKNIKDLKYKFTKLKCFKCEYKGTKFVLEVSNEKKSTEKENRGLKLSRVQGDVWNYKNVCEEILNHM